MKRFQRRRLGVRTFESDAARTKIALAGSTYACHVYRTADFNVAAASSVTIIWVGTVIDIGDMWSSGDPTKFLLPARGLWLINGSIGWNGVVNNARRVRIAINGTVKASKREVSQGQNWTQDVSYLHLATGVTDYATIIAQNDSATQYYVTASNSLTTQAFAVLLKSF